MLKQLLIAAGGQGERLQSDPPKQFLHAGGHPLLVHAIAAFVEYDPTIRVVVVLPRGYKNMWDEICKKHDVGHHTAAEGGPTRFHSVKSGLKHIDPSGLVAIHDGVRPLVSQQLIANVFDMAGKVGNAIPAVTPFESVRLKEQVMNKPLPRDKVRLIQTPQCFRASLIIKAYDTHYDESFTDDATVLEKKGERLFLVDGDRENIKVTTHSDLVTADALLQRRQRL